MNDTRKTSPTVVNKRYEGYDVYIGRGSIWGNPFVIGPDGTREEVIQKYKEYLTNSLHDGSVPFRQLSSLGGKRLGCFCKPKACHGDVIVEIYNNTYTCKQY